MYGSPFPTINPKVRYRTALERAGFDVNFQSGPLGDGSGLGDPEMGRRNVSMGNLQQVPPPRSQNRAAARVASLPGVREESLSRDGVSGSAESLGYARKNPPAVPKPYAPSAQYSAGSQPRSSGASNPSFTFEERPNRQLTNKQTSQERELNPIERSFMLLTQNDTCSSIDFNPRDSAVPSREQAPVDYESASDESADDQPAEQLIQSPTTPRKSVYSTVESLNFEPSSELHVSLSPSSPEKPIPSANGGKQLPVLSVTTHIDPEPKDVIEKQMQPLHISHDDTNWPQGNKYNAQDRHDSPSPDELNTPHTATNLQVEKLIAQLDDVSYSKKIQLDNQMLLTTATNSLSGSQLDVHSLSLDRTRSGSNTSSRFKKSSAYLSQLPETGFEAGVQTVTLDDNGASSPSLKTGDTPTFYKFRQPQTNSFSGPEESITPIIEPLQLSRKDKVEGSPRIEPPQPREDDSSPPASDVPCEDANDAFTPKLEFKHPPGEGPCRTCGEDVHDRRIYSKKANELSGQWHRQCFRCLDCDIKFNKATPCYILDDKPYCQQHYHEENGSICQVCRGFIEGECLENDRTERFHVHCLTCFLCSTQISGDYFIYNSELPLCGDHDLEAILRDGPAAMGGLGGQDNSVSKRRTRLINFTTS